MNSHAFHPITFRTEDFTQLQKNKLLDLIAASMSKNVEIHLHLDINVVSSFSTLISFLQSPPLPSMKIKLKVASISSSAGVKYTSRAQFPHVISVDFGSLVKETELLCLITIIQNAPNVQQVSLCSSNSTWRLSDHETKNIAKFFQVVRLKNVEISCADVGGKELCKDFFVSLKQQNVSFKKVYMKYDPRTKNKEFIDIFNQNLEEIHGLSLLQLTPHFNNVCMPKLTTLDIRCSAGRLLSVLAICPMIENLSWWEALWKDEEDWGVSNNYDQLTLSKLTRLVLGIRFQDTLGIIKGLAARCLYVKSFKCQLECACDITWIYEHFPKLEELQLFKYRGLSLVNITGLNRSSLEFNLRDPIVRRKIWIPYIGDFANLRVLNFGLVNYQRIVAGWRWDIKSAAFNYGICHLCNLNQITFPPMNLEVAERILRLLASKMAHLKLVQFQVWSQKVTISSQDGPPLGLEIRQRKGYWELDEAMKTCHVEKLISAYADTFQIQVIEVNERDDIHYSI